LVIEPEHIINQKSPRSVKHPVRLNYPFKPVATSVAESNSLNQINFEYQTNQGRTQSSSTVFPNCAGKNT
jgi:hypothetical protein